MKGARGEGGSDAEAEPGRSLPGPTHQPFSVESGGMGAAFCGLSWPQFTHVKGRHEVTLEGLHGVTRSWAEGGTARGRPAATRGAGPGPAGGSRLWAQLRPFSIVLCWLLGCSVVLGCCRQG